MMFGRCILDYSNNSLSDISDTKTMVRLLIVAILAVTGFLNVHTVCRLDYITGAMNAPRDLYARLEEGKIVPPSKFFNSWRGLNFTQAV